MHRVYERFLHGYDRFFPPVLRTTPYTLSPLSLPLIMPVTDTMLEKWEQHMEHTKAGNFFLLAQHWYECTSSEKWHFDPVTKQYWDKNTFCFAINFRHNDTLGDVKYVWELNRLQYLQPIALLAYTRKDASLAIGCIQEIESWIDNNPPFSGINWASGIELSMRLVSIAIVLQFCNFSLNEYQKQKIARCIHHHALWLARYLSKFSSANNHKTAEGLGLLVAGKLLSHLKWQKLGTKILEESATSLILRDGVGAEQAVSYHAFTLEMLLLGWKLTGNVSETYKTRLIAGAEYLRWLTDDNGNHPGIGDDDNARVLGVYHYAENYVNSVMGVVAAFTQHIHLSPPCLTPELRNLFFGFPAISTFPDGIKTFAEGGYTVFRNQGTLCVFDHAPLGYLAIAAHGHADTLSLWLHIKGQPVLVDAGTYLYHSGGKLRNFFRGTGIHNTLCMADADSSIIAGHFNWSHKANVHIVENIVYTITAQHDGYYKRFGTIHQRSVSFGDTITIEDCIVSSKPQKVEIGFLLHPHVTVLVNNDVIDIIYNHQCILQLLHTSQLSFSLQQSWYSPRFGEKVPTQRICWKGVLSSGEVAVTQLIYKI